MFSRCPLVRVLGARFLYTQTKQCSSGPTGRVAFSLPRAATTPPQPCTSPHQCPPPENLITRAFVRKGPLSRPRRVVFRALCVCLLSPLPSCTKAFFFRKLLVRLRDLLFDCVVLGPSCHRRAFQLFVSYILARDIQRDVF